MRTIKIIGKGIPKYQQQPGTVNDFACAPGERFDETLGQCVPDINYSASVQNKPQQVEQKDVNGCIVGKELWSVADQKCIPISEVEPLKFNVNSKLSTGTPKTGPGTGVNPQSDFYQLYNTFPGAALAAVGVNMLSGIADKLQTADLQKRVNEAQKRFGMTDSRFGPMRNVYSYGRTPTGYAYNQMVPVQFKGAPTFEAMTVPQFAQDGIEVVRDIMQLPTLYTGDPTASGLYAEDPTIKAAMTRRYADVELPKPTSKSEGLVNVLVSPPVGPDNAPALVPSKKSVGEISYSHNNPLNIHFGSFTKKYGATKGAYDNMGNVAIFPDLNTGIQAAKDLLFSPNSAYFNLRISEARNRWVNGNVDQPSESTRHIVKSMGKDAYISELSPIEKDKLLKLFAKWEGKQGYNAIKNIQLFKEGGVYELDDNDIQQILANGGQIEFL